MGLFIFFRRKPKQEASERFRMSVRNGVESLVASKIKQSYNAFPPADTSIVIPMAVNAYFENIKNSNEFAVISMMTMFGNTWDPYDILEQEKKIILSKLKYLNQ